MGSVSAWRQDKGSDFTPSFQEWGCSLKMLRGEEGEERMQTLEHSTGRAETLFSAPGFVAWFFRLCPSPAEASEALPFPQSLLQEQTLGLPSTVLSGLHSCRRSCLVADTGFAGSWLEPDTGGSSAHLRRAQHHLWQNCGT